MNAMLGPGLGPNHFVQLSSCFSEQAVTKLDITAYFAATYSAWYPDNGVGVYPLTENPLTEKHSFHRLIDHLEHETHPCFLRAFIDLNKTKYQFPDQTMVILNKGVLEKEYLLRLWPHNPF